MNKGYILLLILTGFICSSFNLHYSGVYLTHNGNVSFLSKAKFEKIRAKSEELRGTIDIHKRTFSFSMPISSFQGFFNATQKKHFCERFVEQPKFPETSFKGKIIEDIDLSVKGTYVVRGKGMLMLHGIEKERIIDAQVTVKDGQVSIESKFSIPLEDHGILVSRMNTLAIAKVVDVEVKISMIPE